MERERMQYIARTLGNWLLLLAAMVLVLGILAIWRIGVHVDDRFGFGDPDRPPRLDDYILTLLSYVLLLLIPVSILGSVGLYFRWLAIEQDARTAEFDLLLDVIEGVEPEDIEPDTGSDAETKTV